MIEIIPIYNKNNSSDLANNIYNSTPIGYSWDFNDTKYSICNEEKVSILLFQNKLAVIESPFKKKSNKAYIVNLENEILFDISDAFYLKFNKLFLNKVCIFTDIHISDNALFFNVNINGTDFRFSIDIENKELGDLIESK